MIVYFDKIYNFNEKFCSHDSRNGKTERKYNNTTSKKMFWINCSICKYIATFAIDSRTKFPNDFTLISIKFDIPGVNFYIYNKVIAISKWYIGSLYKDYNPFKKLNFKASSNGINLETFHQKEVSKYLALI